MTARVRLSIPAAALGGVTEILLRAGVAAAVLEHLGEAAEVELVSDGPDIHVAAGERAPAEALVGAIDAWLDGVVGPQVAPRRARIELEVAVRPQLPQRNPQIGRARGVTPVTSWG